MAGAEGLLAAPAVLAGDGDAAVGEPVAGLELPSVAQEQEWLKAPLAVSHLKSTARDKEGCVGLAGAGDGQPPKRVVNARRHI